jgi:TPR repeat protein
MDMIAKMMCVKDSIARRIPALALLILSALAVASQAQPNDRPTGLPKRPFEGTFKDDSATLTLKWVESIPGEAYSGTLTRGADSFPVSADGKNGKLEGSFRTADGDQFPFTAEMDGTTLKFSTGRSTLNLKSQAKAKINPFDQPGPATPANPLDKPANPLDKPRNPLAQPVSPPPQPDSPPSNHDRPASVLPKDATTGQLQSAAEAGDANAMNRLGVVYGNGEGVPVDFAKAVEWYKKAADAGNPDAKANLGIMYEEGHGVSTDTTKAMVLYRSAASAGSTFAMNRIGVMFADGKGMKPDPVEAAKWYRKAADAGSPEGMNYLAVCYLNGKGVEEDAGQCVALLEKAAERKYTTAIRNLGKLYKFGRGVPKDPAKAMEWFVKGAHLGDAESMRLIAELYAAGAGMDKPDEAKATAWYQSAAQMGDEPARQWLVNNGPGAAPNAGGNSPRSGGKGGSLVGQWAIGGDLAADKFVLTFDKEGNVSVADGNGNSSSGPTYAYADNAIKFDGSVGINNLSIGGSWKLNWNGADEFSTTDGNGKKLVLTRVGGGK